MSAHYTMREMPDMNGEGKTRLYPKLIISSCSEENELCERIADNSTFSPGEIQGILISLCKEMAHAMANGQSVRINGLGVFTPSLSLREGKEEEQADDNGTHRNAVSLEIGNVNFRPDKELVLETNRHCRLVRSKQSFRIRRPDTTPEERLALALRYLEKHPTLTVSEYAELTGLSRTAASDELRRWGHETGSGIGIQGRGSHRIYVLDRQE